MVEGLIIVLGLLFFGAMGYTAKKRKEAAIVELLPGNHSPSAENIDISHTVKTTYDNLKRFVAAV
ncbi:MAG: hypothetical protein LBH98_07940 [Chitinispirillales bacterium]|jgi:hypothetical protein|nr:hypothetical protein [Chitinispirillales bacterium]